MKKRLFALAMTLCMVFTMLPSVALAEGSELPTEKWVDAADTAWYNTTDTVFTISTAAQLAGLAKLVNDSNTFANKTIKLGANIDLSGKLWTPIGQNSTKYFGGEFDGQGHTISNLTIGAMQRMGLFGVIKGAYIHDLTLDKVVISVTATNNQWAGSLVGNMYHYNLVKNIHVSNVIMNVAAYVSGDSCIGGVAGSANSSQGSNITAMNITINCTRAVKNGDAYSTNIGGLFGVAQSTLHPGTSGETKFAQDLLTVTGRDDILSGTSVTEGGKTYVLNTYFEDCSGKDITINVTPRDASNGGGYVGGFIGNSWDSRQYSGDAVICQDCAITGLEVNVIGDKGCSVGGFIGLRAGIMAYDYGDIEKAGFAGCSVQGVMNGKNGTYGGFVGESRDDNGGTPVNTELTYSDATANVDVLITDGGTATVGGFAGSVTTNLKRTIPQSFSGCEVLGEITAPDTATVGGLIGQTKTPASGGDITVDNCQIAALEQLDQYMEDNDLSKEEATKRLLFGNGAELSNGVVIGEGNTAPIFAVSFDMNGHGEAVETQNIEKNKTAAEPAAPEAEGFTFGGWYTDEDCTTEYDFTTPITKDITLYAKWTENLKLNAPYEIAEGLVGETYMSEPLTATGGNGNYTFRLLSGPEGLTINEENQLVFTRPAVQEATTAEIEATDGVMVVTFSVVIGAVTGPETDDQPGNEGETGNKQESLPTIVRGDKAEQVTDAAGNALGAYLDMTAEELAEAVFTSADPRPNRKVRLAVVDAANSLNAAQRNALEEAALGDVIVSYLDITLFKQAGSGREQQVTRTNAPIRITLQVPAWAINHDPAVSRMYYMLHWHDGEVEHIYGDFDPAAGTFTFETDCFSPYALCYTDVTTLGVPKTGTGVGLFAGGALLLAAGLCLLRARKKKA